MFTNNWACLTYPALVENGMESSTIQRELAYTLE